MRWGAGVCLVIVACLAGVLPAQGVDLMAQVRRVQLSAPGVARIEVMILPPATRDSREVLSHSIDVTLSDYATAAQLCTAIKQAVLDAIDPIYGRRISMNDIALVGCPS